MPPLANATARTVAVVDDDPAVLGALHFALWTEGYNVRTFASAEAALAADGIEKADCYILDVRLPGIGGLEFLARLRKQGVKAPAVVVTTHPDPRCRRDAQQSGAQIVEKPLMGDALSRKIGDLLART